MKTTMKESENENNAADGSVESSGLLALLNEAYVFISLRHKAHNPWRNALDDWQSRVESKTGWNSFEEIEKFRANAEL